MRKITREVTFAPLNEMADSQHREHEESSPRMRRQSPERNETTARKKEESSGANPLSPAARKRQIWILYFLGFMVRRSPH